MSVLGSQVESSDAFEERRPQMEALVGELRERSALVARGGGEKALEKHRSRGKLTARERVDRLLDRTPPSSSSRPSPPGTSTRVRRRAQG